VYKRQNL